MVYIPITSRHGAEQQTLTRKQEKAQNDAKKKEFKKTEANLEAYCEFIYKKHKSSLMIANINYTEKCYRNFIKHYSNHKNSINYLLTNMRMSICELG